MAVDISWWALLWCLLPVSIVAWVFYQWQAGLTDLLVATARMLVQLIAVGYCLLLLFAQPSVWISWAVMIFMLLIATWIALRPVRQHANLYQPALGALSCGVGGNLIIAVAIVLPVEPWYQPNILIPMAGMLFANSMNSISLSAERFFAEREHSVSCQVARNRAFKATMIPQINSLLAVGLVALPGMMTGQILSGVSPLVAVRYQILIMSLILGATGIASAIFLSGLVRQQTKLAKSI